MDKLLSIIIPSYNMEKYLDKCIGSLIVDDKELLQKLDVVVVNDGSNDRTSEIGHVWESKYPGVVRVIDKVNGNYGSCINAALSIAEGRYVKILDADDSFDTQNLSGLLALLTSVNCDVILSDWQDVASDGGTTRQKCCEAAPDKVFNLIEILMGRNCAFLHFALTYKRSVFLDLGYKQKEGISYTDLEWTTIPLVRVRTVYYYPHVVYRYLTGRAGQSSGAVTKCNNYWMIMDMTLHLIEQYRRVRHFADDDVQERLDAILIRHVATIYRLSTIKNVNADIDAFDKRFKEIDKRMYDLAADFKLGRMGLLGFNAVRMRRSNSLKAAIARSVYKLIYKMYYYRRETNGRSWANCDCSRACGVASSQEQK